MKPPNKQEDTKAHNTRKTPKANIGLLLSDLFTELSFLTDDILEIVAPAAFTEAWYGRQNTENIHKDLDKVSMLCDCLIVCR